MKPAVRRKAREYLRDDGSAPFASWLKGLRDARAKARMVKGGEIGQQDADR
ncbi:hypothetical protein [Endozoicomonas sp.]|uniref:hypothetical protein n=1 Tax=Endozoicomonas sp. TaxID=1892382 RepID=UPI00383A69DA